MDLSVEGEARSPFMFPVEAGKVREFARATFAEREDYLNGELAPPTFLYSARLWQDPETDPLSLLDLDQERALHAEQEFIFHGPPIAVGENLTGVGKVERIYSKQGRRGGLLTFALIVTQFRDSEGRLRAECRQLAVEPEGSPKASE